MPIVIDTERDRPERVEVPGGAFLVSLPNGDEAQRELAKHYDSRTGETDTIGAATALMKRQVKGWESVVDRDGEPIPFSDDLVDIVIDGLPLQPWRALEEAMLRLYVDGAEGKEGSSSGSSGTD